jgi:hypothetical protein
VVTLPDLPLAALPDTFSLRDRLAFSLGVPPSARRATPVIAVSASTRCDLVRRDGVPEDRIRVTREAADPRVRPIEDPPARAAVRRRSWLHGPSLLSVGNLQPRKQFGVLWEAPRAARADRGGPHRLGVVGQPRGHTPRIRAAARRLGIEPPVYPALYELDPHEPRAWAEARRRASSEREPAARPRAAGRARAARFAWERPARQTAAVYVLRARAAGATRAVG